jgi:hypothetical protein
MNPENKVFGSRGDFITSPEISQMFGEVWVELFLQVKLSSNELTVIHGNSSLLFGFWRNTKSLQNIFLSE